MLRADFGLQPFRIRINKTELQFSLHAMIVGVKHNGRRKSRTNFDDSFRFKMPDHRIKDYPIVLCIIVVVKIIPGVQVFFWQVWKLRIVMNK